MERLLLLLFMGVLFFSCSDSSINKESNNTTQIHIINQVDGTKKFNFHVYGFD